MYPQSPLRSDKLPPEAQVKCGVDCVCNDKTTVELKKDVATGEPNMEHAKLILEGDT